MGNACAQKGELSMGGTRVGLTPELRQEIRAALMGNNIFSDVITQKKLTEHDMDQIVGRFVPEPYEEGEMVFRIGDAADRCYYIERGAAGIINRDGVKFLELGPGSLFGEIGFLNGATRQASISANKRSVFFSLSLKEFEHITQEDFDERDLFNVPVVREAFSHASLEDMSAALKLMKEGIFKYRRGEFVCSAMTKNKFFYLIIRGSIRLSSPTNCMKEIEELSDNDYFGEVAIINDSEQICEQCAQVSSQGETIVVKISEQDFKSGVFRPVKDLLTRRMINTRKHHHKNQLRQQIGSSAMDFSNGEDAEESLFTPLLDTVTIVTDAVGLNNSPSLKERKMKKLVTEELGDTGMSKKNCSPMDCLLIVPAAGFSPRVEVS